MILRNTSIGCGIDAEGMFNMYEMESDYGHMKLDIIIERFIRNGFHKKNAIIAYVLIDMLMNGINEHIYDQDDSTGEDTAHNDINYHDIAAGLNALIEHIYHWNTLFNAPSLLMMRMIDNNLTLVFCWLELHKHVLVSIFKRIA